MIQINKIILGMLIALVAYGCSTTINTQAEYASATPRATSDLAVPPGLSSPEVNSNYTLSNPTQSTNGYQLNKINGMQIVEAGSERWLVVKNKTVNEIWPIMLAYLNQMGLTLKYQNKMTGLIQTDWATKNNNVPQGNDIRGIFDWLGWGNMYSLPSQYMFRINLWQNESNTQIFVTNYQMNEVYSSCKQPYNSSVETSDYERTKWVPVPPNPQLELDFLLNFMAFAGLNQGEVKQMAVAANKAKMQNPLATLVGSQLILTDQFDRAWWRTGLALERVGLGVTDKNRSQGLYYVYPLQSQIDNPEPGLFSRWFGSESNTLELPKAKYIVQLTAKDNQTIVTLSLYPGVLDKDFTQNQQKYLTALLKQLQ